MRDLVLTGFMATGKTTIGRILARRYGLKFVDTDTEIERRSGRTVNEIITQDGEPAFRRLERDALERMRSGSGRVIATGGGALLSADNRSLFDSEQPVLCLSCEPLELLRRLDGAAGRPLMDPPSLQRIGQLLEERSAAYAAFPQVDTSRANPERVADEIADMYPLDRVGCLDFPRSPASSILLAEGLLDRLGELMRDAGIRGEVLLVTDTNVQASGLVDRVAASLSGAGQSFRCVVVPAGEREKSLLTLERLFVETLQAGLDRSGTVIGLGGGVIGDLAGMLAATYMRGVRLVLAPTTLLAQVDAAIGGKVAVDVAQVKNLAGAFHPAEIVAIDPSSLSTLAVAHLADGLAEIIKIGFMRSSDLVEDLESLETLDDIRQRTDIIRRAVQLKVDLVRQDPFERDERMLLNFGHSVGHGFEAASDYRLSHGQAVAAGMIAELRLAVRAGWAPANLLARLLGLMERMQLTRTAPGVDPEEAIRAIRADKKRARGSARLAVPTALGQGAVFEASDEDIRLAIRFALEGGS